MRVTQEMIARKVGLDRSTVSKILNGRASNFVSSRTVSRVLDAARELGYDLTKLRHTHSRQFERTHLNLKAEFDIMLANGQTFDSGVATITNISEGSALITNISSKRTALPIEPFTISLIVQEGYLKDVCVLARVTRLDMRDKLGLALEFVEDSPVSASKLRNFMEKTSNPAQASTRAAAGRLQRTGQR